MSLFHAVRGQGQPLVLLHGWAMHSGIFASLVERLESAFAVHLVDLPGHGRSRDAGVPLTLAAAADAVAATVPERALWLGWSLGGLVALQVAATRPAAVRGLVALAASPRFVRADDWPHGMDAALFASFARDLGADWRTTVDRFLALEANGSEHMREDLRLLRAQVFAHGEPEPSVLADGLRVLADGDLRTMLPTLAMPSLWLAGRRDRIAHPEALRAAAATAPRARFVQVERAGHAPFLTHDDEVVEAVLAFAAECPP
jgi:pimeloyl-[acyl-carrier protein] methyl ester esterase